MARKSKKKNVTITGLLGVGLDNEDGHQRITRGEDFLLVGGCQETRERMQDVAIRVTEALQAQGKRLQDTAPPQLGDLIRKALDR